MPDTYVIEVIEAPADVVIEVTDSEVPSHNHTSLTGVTSFSMVADDNTIHTVRVRLVVGSDGLSEYQIGVSQ